ETRAVIRVRGSSRTCSMTTWCHFVTELSMAVGGCVGFRVERQGKYANVVALPETTFGEVILVGAHYDSVPRCPGADDNGSAVAAMLGCAAACSLWRPALPVIFV